METMLDICNLRMVHLLIWILNSVHAFYIKVIHIRETRLFPTLHELLDVSFEYHVRSKPRDCKLNPLITSRVPGTKVLCVTIKQSFGSCVHWL